MSQETILSIGAAVVIGLGYGGAVFAVLRRAMRESGQRFMIIFLGGMVARFVGLLVLVVLAVLLLPVRATVFVAVLVPLLIMFIGLEIAFILRHAHRS
ncbi:MAG: hypothetical protein ACOCSK_01170 [Rhodothermales bacterium]